MLAPERPSLRRLPGYAFAALGAVLLVSATTATGAGSNAHPEPRILSASWGTDNAVGCPNGEQGLDNILCLVRPPRGAKLTGVTIGGGLIQDPNGDPNVAQKFRAPQPGRPDGK